MALYMVCRLLFYGFNHSYFSTSSFTEILKAFIYGVKFDAAAIILSNCLFIFLSILPLAVWMKNWYQSVLKWLFVIINSVFVLLNCIDFIYFKFTAKRTTSDWFQMWTLGNDMGNLLPQIVRDFWYVLLIWFFLIFLLVKFYPKTKIKPEPVAGKKFSVALLKWLFIPVIIFCCVIVIRGGVQFKPMSIMSASKYSSPQNSSLVLNTPFTILRTFGKSELEEVNYMSEAQAKKYFSLTHQYSGNSSFRPLNIVVIILESFSKEYIGGLNPDYPRGEGYTPFLDSLMKESLACTNAYANSKKSIEGIPAVLAGIPALMIDPFITSVYNGNKINSIASLLKEKSYTTGFFHGGNNGTMGFDNFAKAAGFDFYKGRKEYGDKDYDGDWGIYDEPFYKYFIGEINKMQKPFMTCIFSVSSHHPYSIPAKYKGKFKKGNLPIHESVMYADYSLKTFFDAAEKQNWFDSTLFIITTDHTGPSAIDRYQTKKGIYEIPIIFYHHSKLKGIVTSVAQQCDILPSVMHYLNYDGSFNAFGNSLFDTTATRFAANYLVDFYQLITDDYLLQFDGEKNIAMYEYKSDHLIKKNILDEKKESAETKSLLLKSIIQQFNYAMIHNRINGK